MAISFICTQFPGEFPAKIFRTFQDFLIDVKSGDVLFFQLSENRYGMRLQNEPFFIIIAQGAAKL